MSGGRLGFWADVLVLLHPPDDHLSKREVHLMDTTAGHGPFPPDLQNPTTPQQLLALEEFIHELFVQQLEPSFFWAFGVAAILLVILILVGFTIIIHRTIQGKFWLVRLVRRSEGCYWVPNALNSFTLLEGCFAIVEAVYALIVYLTYYKRIAMLQHHSDALLLLVWLPLYLGGLYAAIGSAYMAPDMLDASLTKRSSLSRRLRSPWLLNAISIGTPLALTAGIVTCAVLAQNHMSNSFEAYQRWSANLIEVANTSTTISTAQGQALLAAGGNVWNRVNSSKWYLAVGYAVWTAFAALLLAFYIPVGGYMLAQLRRQVNTQQDLIQRHKQQHKEMLEAKQKRLEGRGLVLQQDGGTGGLRNGRDIEADPLDSLLFQPLSDPGSKEEQTMTSTAFRSAKDTLSMGQASSGMVFTPNQETGEAPQVALHPSFKQEARPTEAAAGLQAAALHNDEDPNGDIYFPPLRPSQRKLEWQSRQNSSVDAGPAVRWKYLRRTFRSLLILYLGIIAGILLYLTVAARCAANLYDEIVVRGPAGTTYIMATSQLTAAWAAVVFGTLTLGAIFFRFFDAPPTTESQDKKIKVKAGGGLVAEKGGSSSDGGFASGSGSSGTKVTSSSMSRSGETTSKSSAGGFEGERRSSRQIPTLRRPELALIAEQDVRTAPIPLVLQQEQQQQPESSRPPIPHQASANSSEEEEQRLGECSGGSNAMRFSLLRQPGALMMMPIISGDRTTTANRPQAQPSGSGLIAGESDESPSSDASDPLVAAEQRRQRQLQMDAAMIEYQAHLPEVSPNSRAMNALPEDVTERASSTLDRREQEGSLTFEDAPQDGPETESGMATPPNLQVPPALRIRVKPLAPERSPPLATDSTRFDYGGGVPSSDSTLLQSPRVPHLILPSEEEGFYYHAPQPRYQQRHLSMSAAPGPPARGSFNGPVSGSSSTTTRPRGNTLTSMPQPPASGRRGEYTYF